MIGAGISTMNNIAEGFDSQSNAEFMRFFKISRRHVSEVETCLYAALDQNHIDSQEFALVFNEAELQRKPTDGMLRYLRGQKGKQSPRKHERVLEPTLRT